LERHHVCAILGEAIRDARDGAGAQWKEYFFRLADFRPADPRHAQRRCVVKGEARHTRSGFPDEVNDLTTPIPWTLDAKSLPGAELQPGTLAGPWFDGFSAPPRRQCRGVERPTWSIGRRRRRPGDMGKPPLSQKWNRAKGRACEHAVASPERVCTRADR